MNHWRISYFASLVGRHWQFSIFPIIYIKLRYYAPDTKWILLLYFTYLCSSWYNLCFTVNMWRNIWYNTNLLEWFATGTLTFIIGMIINITSDSILRNLRKDGKSGYKIPYGGLFKYISGANFFGECIEWIGYALLARTLPTFAFAFFTLCNLAPRAYQHHRWFLPLD